MTLPYVILLLLIQCAAHCSLVNVLDLSKTPLRSVAKVYNGEFRDGGRYRMIHPTAGYLPEVLYGCKRLKTARKSKKFHNLYIEEYRRGVEVFVEFIGVYTRKNGDLAARVRVYDIRDGTPVISSTKSLSDFINGAVLLYVNMDTLADIHPFVSRLHAPYDGDVEASSQIADRALEYRNVRVLIKHTYYTLFSYMAALPPDPHGLPLSSIISCSRKIIRQSNLVDYSVILNYQGIDVEYIVNPVTGSVAMKGGEVQDNTAYWKPLFWNMFGRLRNAISVVIRVGEQCDYSPHILLLSNVPKGAWLYSRYEVVPFINVSHLNARVLEGRTGVTIYQSPSEAFLSSVEVFVEHKHGWQYVIVRFSVLEGFSVTRKMRIYKRLTNDRGNSLYIKLYGKEMRVYEELLRAIYDQLPDDYDPAQTVNI
ncbi:hypothetical protein X943_001671 [Babesia divergens]|uniref:Uncharacterized protein n=1 Tax=Babesia divergens TaxID=32595 RepID=A0AAD9LI03_BABDI|nr:hypothetical protein X943_001671 [Babesia divergens]